MNWQPMDDRVIVVLEQKAEMTAGGIYVPQNSTTDESTMKARVVAVGPGRILQSGEYLPLKIAVGDEVMFNKYGGFEIREEETTYLVLSSNDITVKRTL